MHFALGIALYVDGQCKWAILFLCFDSFSVRCFWFQFSSNFLERKREMINFAINWTASCPTENEMIQKNKICTRLVNLDVSSFCERSSNSVVAWMPVSNELRTQIHCYRVFYSLICISRLLCFIWIWCPEWIKKKTSTKTRKHTINGNGHMYTNSSVILFVEHIKQNSDRYHNKEEMPRSV